MNEDQIEQEIAETNDAPLDLRGEIENAIKEVKEKEAPDEVREEKPAKQRDETGKFAKKEVVDKPVDETPKTVAPQSWKAEYKDKFATLPPEIQAEIMRREEEVDKTIKNQDEERLFGKQLKETITPYLPIIQAEGGTPATAVKDLLNTAYVLRTGTPEQKRNLILRTAQQYGVDLTQVSQQSDADPQVQALYQKIESLEGRLTQQDMSREQQERAAIQSEIDAFASNPDHRHFETVKADIAALLNGGRATDLKDAYQKAVWANPDTRSALLAEQEAKRVAEIKAKADAARKAGSSVTGSPGATAPKVAKVQDRGLREELEANFRAAMSG